MIAVYVSGHGYGHATRTGEVLRTLRGMAPGLPLEVVTSGPEALYREAVPGSFGFRAEACDVGLVQRGSLLVDESATVEACAAFAAAWPSRLAREAAWLRSKGARLVLGDIPPLAFAAAAEAGLPAVGLGNFSWDWIYRHAARREPRLAEAAQAAASAYRGAELLLELPFAGDLSAFPRRERVGLVARRPRLTRDEARRRLGLDAGPVVLVSFGGFGLPGFDLRLLGPLPCRFLIVDEPGPAPANLRNLTRGEIAALGLRYQDLLSAADVVVTKPGYGIVTDAIGARCRMVYTDRGDFPEYPILVREMTRWLPARHLPSEDVLAGRWAEAVEGVLGDAWPGPADLGGAEVAARRLLERAGA